MRAVTSSMLTLVSPFTSGGGTLDGDIVIEQQVDKRGQVIDADPAVAVQLSVPQTYSSFINNSSIIRAKSLMVT